MLQKRADHDDDSIDRTGEMAALETGRSVAEAGAKAGDHKKDEEHISIFWRVFGGTILSIVALVSITLYNNMSSGIAELRAEVSREREARADLVKKDEYNARVTAQYERMRGIDSLKVELEGLKEKVSTNATALDGSKRDSAASLDAIKKDFDGIKKDAATLAVLKERMAALEGVKKDIAGLDAIKEKLTAAAADLKVLRDELTKVSGDVERNKVSDLERKANRDSQAKQVEEALKELQKGLQDCREKLARLEGQKPTAEPPVPFARPTSPAKPNDVKPAGGTGKPTPPPAGPDDEK